MKRSGDTNNPFAVGRYMLAASRWRTLAVGICASILTACLFTSCSSQKYPFRDESLPVEARVSDLVSRLTLEEKVAQMASNTPAIERLGIPAYDWQNECLHGVGKLAEYKVTVYPQPIGLAATWNQAGVHRMADFIAEEGRAIYHDALRKQKQGSYYGLTYWAPNINIFRDPRWGRGHETFGEDPYLTGVLGKAYVRGLQGDDPRYLKASACAKHYAVHSGPESLRHEFNTEVSTYDLWDTYLPAFRELVREADVTGVMCAYNAYGGRPCCGSDLLMMDILRQKWGFTGYVTSDCGAIDDFYKYHRTHPDTISAASDAVLHGTDLDCVRDVAFKTLVEAVKQGRIKEEDIDRAVTRLFTIRFRLGMFDADEQVRYASTPLSVLECDAHKEQALTLAQQSIVLLKNEGKTLPLSKDLKKIAVIGPNAATDLGLLGNYHGYPSQIVTVLDAIKAKVSPETEVYYEKMVNHLTIDDFVSVEQWERCTYNNQPGFKAEYFDNIGFDGTPQVRQESVPALHYRGETKVADTINSLAFAVRYTTGFSPAESGDYTFDLDTDKRFRLSIGGKTCIDALKGKAKANGRVTIYLEKGQTVELQIEAVMKGRHGDLSFRIGHTKTPSLRELAMRVKDADAIVFVGGISPELEGEQNGVQCPGFEDGDRTTILFPEVQTRLMKELVRTGKPVVLVMLTGSALAMEWESEQVPAILNAWYGGQYGGTAVGDVLFGDYNPSGRLPVTFYRKDSDLPPFTDYSMEGRTYRYFKGEPRYPFGFGLSYTSFAYQELTVAGQVNTTDSLTVSVTVTNTGSRDGEEVAQLYLSHLDKESYLPLRALKGFERLSLKAGESHRVTFVLASRDLATYNDFGECVVRPGQVKLCVGGGQPGTGVPTVEQIVRIEGKPHALKQ